MPFIPIKLAEIKGLKLVISLRCQETHKLVPSLYLNLLHTCQVKGETNTHFSLKEFGKIKISCPGIPSRTPAEVRLESSILPSLVRDVLISYANALLSLSEPQCSQFGYLTCIVFSI